MHKIVQVLGRAFAVSTALAVSCKTVETCSVEDRNMNTEISLVLEANADSFHSGSEVELRCILSNKCAHVVTLLPQGPVYTVMWIDISDAWGRKQKEIIRALYRVTPPKREDFVELKPGEKHPIIFRGQVGEGEIRSLRGEIHQGLFIDFQDSAFLLEKPGSFTVTAYYKPPLSAGDALREFGVLGVFDHEITSPPLAISVGPKE